MDAHGAARARMLRRRARLAVTLHFYLALGLGWGHAMSFFTPTVLAVNLNTAGVVVWTVLTMLGGAVASVGYALKSGVAEHEVDPNETAAAVLTLARQQRARRMVGLLIEFVGVAFLIGGPIQYLAVQVAFIVGGDFLNRYALAWLAWAMIAAVLMRGLPIAIDVALVVREMRARR